jgi:hypothetical protein
MYLDDGGDVGGLETADGKVDVLPQLAVHALTDQVVEVDRATQQLEVPLLEDDVVARLGRVESRGAVDELELLLVGLVQQQAGGLDLEVGVDLFADLEDELIEAQVDLGLNLVVQESLVQRVQRPVGRIVVQVERVQQELVKSEWRTQTF